MRDEPVAQAARLEVVQEIDHDETVAVEPGLQLGVAEDAARRRKIGGHCHTPLDNGHKSSKRPAGMNFREPR